MTQRKSLGLILLLTGLMLLTACGGLMARPETAAQTTETYGLVAGNIDDGGFNQLAWEGLQRAADEFGVEVEHLELSADNTNAAENIAQFVDEDVNGIVTVGFELSTATRAASQANPELPFVSVDEPSQTAGDLGLLFDVDTPSFMAGYLAAGMTETGTVCTYGGRQTPPVLAFMVGFEHGVAYYNEQNEAAVQLLGWQTDPGNPIGGEGAFTGNFTDSELATEITTDLFDQGCDIIFPVAGAMAVTTARLAEEAGLTVIGVDADQTRTEPDLAEVYLTSVVKQIDVTVFEAIKAIHEGTFEGGKNLIGTLENGGVGLAPFHSFEAAVPQQLKEDLATIEQELIDGTISTGWPIFRVPAALRLTEEVLRNTSYPVDYTAGGSAPLVDGVYEEEAAPGSASVIRIQLSDSIAFGDLDGDGVQDAAVILISETGGSGTFYDLVAVIDRNGQPFPVATANLGDRIELNELAIENGEIVVDMVTQGPDDPMATPTQPETRRYRIQVTLEQIEEEAAAGNNGALSPEQLGNATYSGIYDEPVTLTEGRYEGEPYVEGDSSRPIVEYMNNSELYGDLNGDGAEDAVVFLVESGGGTGNFIHVAAQLNQNGQPVDAGAVWIEDRIQIISAAIEDGQVILEITAEGPGDAACCKTHKTSARYALQDGQLAELPGEGEEALERISAADLNGTKWTLLEFDDEQPA